ncbi:SecDF P1 head subdomain-containing protein [Thermophilibacter immobilis]|jgi:preprotein translocase subunit SecD/SecD/SecF fusion protein|uniref:SecDF P1 head subdomain domain-containing protein n=1 Tax=Thermophilibacter immobilis TaxID=2779519 RepID=A0A7S7M766_9ACTN|nr:hypothetical protein [Thermophilibacter immobilis]QOY60009.1 hypothetical protein INP52_06155 [Thermophilibacter immobilis]
MADKRFDRGAANAREAAKKAPASRQPWRRSSKQRRRCLAALASALVLVVVGLALAWPPAERLGWGIDFAGGTASTFIADDPSSAGAAATLVARRLEKLGVTGARVSADEDGTLEVVVPAGQDATSAVSSATRTGHVELVRLDAISDPEVVAKIQAGSTGLSLDAGSYSALVDGSEVSSAQMASLSSTTDSYALTLSFSSDAAARFEEATGQLASVGGKIVLLVDGTVVSAPSVNAQITGGQVTVPVGTDAADAQALAIALGTGSLPVTLSVQGTSAVAASVGAGALRTGALACGVALLVAVVALFATLGPLGLLSLLALVASALLELGGLAALSRSGAFVPSVYGYGTAALSLVVLLAVYVGVVVRFRGRVRGGSTAVDAAGAPLRPLYRELLVAAGLLVLAFVVARLVGAASTEAICASYVWLVALAAGALSLPLVLVSLLRLAARGSMRDNPGAWRLEPVEREVR